MASERTADRFIFWDLFMTEMEVRAIHTRYQTGYIAGWYS